MENRLYFIEIAVKNVILAALTFYSYGHIADAFSVIQDQGVLNTLILFVGLIIVVPLFGCFAFTYELINQNSIFQRMLAHVIAFTIMLATFMLLLMIDVLFIMLVGDILIFRFVLLLLLISIFLYDFWDALRLTNKK